jgi:hypothetical protein
MNTKLRYIFALALLAQLGSGRGVHAMDAWVATRVATGGQTDFLEAVTRARVDDFDADIFKWYTKGPLEADLNSRAFMGSNLFGLNEEDDGWTALPPEYYGSTCGTVRIKDSANHWHRIGVLSDMSWTIAWSGAYGCHHPYGRGLRNFGCHVVRKRMPWPQIVSETAFRMNTRGRLGATQALAQMNADGPRAGANLHRVLPAEPAARPDPAYRHPAGSGSEFWDSSASFALRFSATDSMDLPPSMYDCRDPAVWTGSAVGCE